ncbi:MAG: hypothetical protein A2201_02950 [Alicyclobacillus sp. RIFOXYA1_FULL_53_8]|nr:MAG: hypothetical protein A2201_02950 [Alicyclobacillus sp. RIFOXYA1_FULL_53_8]
MAKYHHIILETLAPGVFAAIASPTGAAGSNSGIIDLGDQTIVFDTTATLSAAQELLSAAQELTGRAPKYVINSHSHPDHVHGNAIFSETSALISSSVTRDEIARDGIEAMANMHNDLTTQVTSFREQLVVSLDASERAELEAAIEFFGGVLNGYPAPEDLRIPNVTYHHELDFHGPARLARLLTFGGAHSACDAVLWLPEQKVLFSGDVIGNPILCLGYPENWWTILETLESLGAERIVPGHGEVWSAKAGYETTRQHLNFMFSVAQQAMDSGNPLHFTETVPVPAGQSDYWFRKDLRFLAEHRMAGKLL